MIITIILYIFAFLLFFFGFFAGVDRQSAHGGIVSTFLLSGGIVSLILGTIVYLL